MSLLNFTSLDFDQIKDTLKQYLQSNSNFTDYDFEGSNLATILDVLAYNTYITSYNANMISNEVFIDSATLRENVVALARNIGYVPRSKKASTATINFTVEPGITPPPTTITLKKEICKFHLPPLAPKFHPPPSPSCSAPSLCRIHQCWHDSYAP